MSKDDMIWAAMIGFLVLEIFLLMLTPPKIFEDETNPQGRDDE